MPNEFHVRVTPKPEGDNAISYMLDDRFFHDQNDAVNAAHEVFSDEDIMMVQVFKSGVPAPVVQLDR